VPTQEVTQQRPSHPSQNYLFFAKCQPHSDAKKESAAPVIYAQPSHETKTMGKC
jgi:hypothetical protein